jgi:hypothetical protein
MAGPGRSSGGELLRRGDGDRAVVIAQDSTKRPAGSHASITQPASERDPLGGRMHHPDRSAPASLDNLFNFATAEGIAIALKIKTAC